MEIWDLYDKDRNKLNKTMVRGDEIPQGYFHLVVESIIVNSSNKILIQKRHPEKIGWPNTWEFSCGGSATTNDSSLMAITREIDEEIGIKLNPDNIEDIVYNSFDQSHYDFYFIKQDIDISEVTMQPTEVVDVKWADLNDILNLLDNEQFVPYQNYGRNHFEYIKDKINENHN